eukprot:6202839-Pleurochrysis_carterae.AAC.1
MLLAAEEEKCTSEALIVCSMLSLRSPFASTRSADLEAARQRFAVYEGDAVTLLNVVRCHRARLGAKGPARASQWCRRVGLLERVLQRAAHVENQLRRQLLRTGVPPESVATSCDNNPALGGTTGTNALRRAIVAGFFANAAIQKAGGHYTTARRAAPMELHPNSVLYRAPPEVIVFHETLFTTEREHIMSATKVLSRPRLQGVRMDQTRAEDGDARARAHAHLLQLLLAEEWLQ